jgi:anhydro-N-acetylmuramic acid kinase
MSDLYIGLMSGTSLDGVDGVLADFSGAALQVLAHAYTPFSSELRSELLALNTSGADELHRAALAANALARAYASVVSDLLAKTGIDSKAVVAIGAHGQTVRHRPQEFDSDASQNATGGYTLQLNNPSLLAELAHIDVVADFRSRDVAAGGQGAPLVPAFHQAIFGNAQGSLAVLNIGGISNVTLLHADSALGQDVSGFDCGPGNALMDHWCQAHTGQAFDAGGQWAASGQVHADLLANLLNEPYFSKSPPKSTGRDLFNLPWLTHKLLDFANISPADVQATLTELTARVCAASLSPQLTSAFTSQFAAATMAPKKLIVCGGGALNLHLMGRLAALSGLSVESSQYHGLPPLQVESAAFAWLARQCVRREAGNVPKVTGAQGARILGAIYPA